MTDQSGSQNTPASMAPNRRVCPVCESTEIDTSIPTLDPVCTECGTVVTAAPNLDLVADVDGGDGDRATTWEEEYTIANSTEQQVAHAFEVLETIGPEIGAPIPVREQAAEIYAEAAVENVTDGRATELLVAACLTVAGQEYGRAVPSNRIACVAGVEANTLRRISRTLRQKFGYAEAACPPVAYLEHLTRVLHQDQTIRATAEELLEALPPECIGGKHPGAIAGAALYLAADGDTTQRELARAMEVTSETIRVRVKECREALTAELGADWADRVGRH